MMKARGATYLSYLTTPCYDHLLHLLDAGQPATVEQESRRLSSHLQHLITLDLDRKVQMVKGAESHLVHIARQGYGMYEGMIVQTLCDALLAQGKLPDAQALMDEALSPDRDWRVSGRPDEIHSGSNPHGRRALAQSLMGDGQAALGAFTAADEFAKCHDRSLLGSLGAYDTSGSWYYQLFRAARLARLGQLTAASPYLSESRSRFQDVCGRVAWIASHR
jgi:hypothetical protein